MVSCDSTFFRETTVLKRTTTGTRVALLVTATAIALGATACSGDDVAPTMPNLVGKTLDNAKSELGRADVEGEPEIVGGGTFGVIIESNWIVCEQVPAAGGSVSGTPRITVARDCTPDAKPTDEPSDPPSSEEPTTPEPKPTATAEAKKISVDDLLELLNTGGSKIGNRYLLTGELVASAMWMDREADGRTVVLLVAQGGKDDLGVGVDPEVAAAWSDGMKVEMVVEDVELTVNGETSGAWLRAVSAKVVSEGSSSEGPKDERPETSARKADKALATYVDTINTLAGTTFVDSAKATDVDGVYRVNLNAAVAASSVLEVQTFIQTVNKQIVDIIGEATGDRASVKYYLAGSVVAENRSIVDPWEVKFKGVLKN